MEGRRRTAAPFFQYSSIPELHYSKSAADSRMLIAESSQKNGISNPRG
jgi:hypothetical protein